MSGSKHQPEQETSMSYTHLPFRKGRQNVGKVNELRTEKDFDLISAYTYTYFISILASYCYVSVYIW
jgi:hypothetical protein